MKKLNKPRGCSSAAVQDFVARVLAAEAAAAPKKVKKGRGK